MSTLGRICTKCEKNYAVLFCLAEKCQKCWKRQGKKYFSRSFSYCYIRFFTFASNQPKVDRLTPSPSTSGWRTSTRSSPTSYSRARMQSATSFTWHRRYFRSRIQFSSIRNRIIGCCRLAISKCTHIMTYDYEFWVYDLLTRIISLKLWQTVKNAVQSHRHFQ